MPTANDAPADSIDPAFHALFALFDGPLRDVAFPDVSRSVLAELAAAVRETDARVAAAEAALESARAALEERQLALLARAQRALAYARVYAEENEPLQLEVERIVLPRAIASKPLSIARADRRDLLQKQGVAPPGEQGARPRGRPRKHRDSTHLFPLAPVEPTDAANANG